jgi:hypothetical protein
MSADPLAATSAELAKTTRQKPLEPVIEPAETSARVDGSTVIASELVRSDLSSRWLPSVTWRLLDGVASARPGVTQLKLQGLDDQG